ncbi:hypothetical protein ATY79_23125 [Rhizobium sp. R693]|nr:hypothetical protein ATY79_23125 [Rhizobium sp. R693]
MADLGPQADINGPCVVLPKSAELSPPFSLGILAIGNGAPLDGVLYDNTIKETAIQANVCAFG